MRVWVTRDEQPGGPLSTALHDAGLTPVLEPVLERRVLDDAQDALSKLGPEDWLVLTSAYAVGAVAPGPARVPRVAVVGEATRLAAHARGFRVELLSPGGDADSLFRALRETVTRARVPSRTKVCYPRSSLARAPEPCPGVDLLCPVLYETVARNFDPNVINRIDVVSVTSPSAVDALRAAGFPTDLSPLGREVRFASIGPTTSAALRRIGVEPWVQAPQRSFEALAKAVARCSTGSA